MSNINFEFKIELIPCIDYLHSNKLKDDEIENHLSNIFSANQSISGFHQTFTNYLILLRGLGIIKTENIDTDIPIETSKDYCSSFCKAHNVQAYCCTCKLNNSFFNNIQFVELSLLSYAFSTKSNFNYIKTQLVNYKFATFIFIDKMYSIKYPVLLEIYNIGSPLFQDMLHNHMYSKEHFILVQNVNTKNKSATDKLYKDYFLNIFYEELEAQLLNNLNEFSENQKTINSLHPDVIEICHNIIDRIHSIKSSEIDLYSNIKCITGEPPIENPSVNSDAPINITSEITPTVIHTVCEQKIDENDSTQYILSDVLELSKNEIEQQINNNPSLSKKARVRNTKSESPLKINQVSLTPLIDVAPISNAATIEHKTVAVDMSLQTTETGEETSDYIACMYEELFDSFNKKVEDDTFTSGMISPHTISAESESDIKIPVTIRISNSTDITEFGILICAQALIYINFIIDDNIALIYNPVLNNIFRLDLSINEVKSYFISLIEEKAYTIITYFTEELFHFLNQNNIVPVNIKSISTMYSVLNYNKKFKTVEKIIKEFVGDEYKKGAIELGEDINSLKLLPKIYLSLEKLVKKGDLISLLEDETRYEYFLSHSLYLAEGKKYYSKTNHFIWSFALSELKPIRNNDNLVLNVTIKNISALYNFSVTPSTFTSACAYAYTHNDNISLYMDVYRCLFINLTLKVSFFKKGIKLIQLNESGFSCIVPNIQKRSITDLINHRIDIIVKHINPSFVPNIVLEWI